jgi:hypothetical protein
MAVSSVTPTPKTTVPGKAKQKVATIVLSGTYTSEGEAITARQLGFRRVVTAVATLAGSNGVEATPVGDCWITGQPGTSLKLRLLNSKTGAELAAGVAVSGVKAEVICTGF